MHREQKCRKEHCPTLVLPVFSKMGIPSLFQKLKSIDFLRVSLCLRNKS